MTDTPGDTSPFGSFPGMTGFPQGDMMEKMWDMMKLNPFAAAAAPGGSPSLSMMSDMLAPLTNVEELDKRIKDMRAVEQWLKLNLNMLQSAIQALEVQRATHSRSRRWRRRRRRQRHHRLLPGGPHRRRKSRRRKRSRSRSRVRRRQMRPA